MVHVGWRVHAFQRRRYPSFLSDLVRSLSAPTDVCVPLSHLLNFAYAISLHHFNYAQFTCKWQCLYCEWQHWLQRRRIWVNWNGRPALQLACVWMCMYAYGAHRSFHYRVPKCAPVLTHPITHKYTCNTQNDKVGKEFNKQWKFLNGGRCFSVGWEIALLSLATKTK